jgi:hypothetical protein
MNNTKRRHQEIHNEACLILAEWVIDITKNVEIGPLSKILAIRVACHRETARRAMARAVRRMRSSLVNGDDPLVIKWGGARPGPHSGRPKKEIKNS